MSDHLFSSCRSACTTLALLGACASSWSADEPELAPVVVDELRPLASQAPDQPAYSRFALPVSVQAVQTLQREDIEVIRPRDVSDLLELALGTSVSRQGARVHNFSYDRGDAVSIVLDGVYLTPSAAQRTLGDIPVEWIESVRFVRDATVISQAPLMAFGSAGSGSPTQGLILIETRKGRPGGDSAEVRASYGSHDTRKGSAWASRSWQDGRYRFGAGYQRAQSDGKADWNNGYEGDSLLLNAGLEDPALKASASLYLNHADRQVQRAIGVYTGTTGYPVSGPTPQGVLDKNIWRYKPVDSAALALNLARPWGDGQVTSLTYGQSKADGQGFFATTLKPVVAAQVFEDRAQEWNLSHTVETADWTAKLGAQYVGWYQQSEGSSLPREEAVYGLFGAAQWRLGKDWTVDTAVRQDRKHLIRGAEAYLASGSKVTRPDGQWMDKASLMSIGGAWRATPDVRLSARYAFNRTPTPDVLTTRNDARLPAERRQRYEMGMAYQPSPAVQLVLTPFYYDLSNTKVSAGTLTTDATGQPLLDAAGNPTSVTVYQAAQRYRHGIEVGAKGRFLDDALDYELGWTHLNDSAMDGLTGNEFARNKYSAALGWRQGAWSSRLTVLRVDPYLSYGYTVGGFTVLNLSLTRALSPRLTLALYGQNLTNEHYGTANKGYPVTANWGVLRDVGTTVGVEVTARF